MTREEVKEMLPVLQAFSEGKTIESRCIKGDKSLWYDDEDPSFDDDFEYRIKPEPKYRPFMDAKECWQEMLKHQPFGWVKTDSWYVPIWHVNEGDDFNATLKDSTFADGALFGIKEERIVIEQKNIRFEKSDLPPDIVKVKVDKDVAPLMPPETLTVKIDYSDRVCTADHFNATKLASSVLPVSSISPFRVEMCKKRLHFKIPVIFKRNTYNIRQNVNVSEILYHNCEISSIFREIIKNVYLCCEKKSFKVIELCTYLD